MSKTAETVSPARKSQPGVGKFMAALILAGEDDTKKILTKVRRKFKDSRATASDVSIIRRRCARGDFDDLKTPTRRRAKAKPRRKRTGKE